LLLVNIPLLNEMPTLKGIVRELREICSPLNIYTLSSLETVLHFGDGLTQQEIADATRQSKQSVQQLEVWMEINGLIHRGENVGLRRTISFTAPGEYFLNKLERLLCPDSTE